LKRYNELLGNQQAEEANMESGVPWICERDGEEGTLKLIYIVGVNRPHL
jgi:hypothetical protein